MEVSKWLIGISLLMAIISVSGIDKNVLSINREEQFFKGYTATKMLMGCYGQETVESWQWTHQKYWYECEREVRPFAPNKTRATAPYHYSDRPFFGVRRTGHLKYHTDVSIQILQCVFSRLNLRVGMNGAVNSKGFRRKIKKTVKMESTLRHYVTHGINECARQSFCENYEHLGEEYVDFLKLNHFYKCVMFSRLSACVKWDLRRNEGNYQLKGLGETLKNLYTNGKRMAVSVFYSNSDHRGPFKYDL